MALKNFILAMTGGVMMLLLLAGNALSQEVKSVWMKSG
jgi:hypothetical protein